MRAAPNCYVRNYMDVIRIQGKLLDDFLLQCFAVHDHAVRSSESIIHNALRRSLRVEIAGVMFGVVNGHHQRIATQQRKREIKPQVPLLVVYNVWPEAPYPPQEFPIQKELPNRLP